MKKLLILLFTILFSPLLSAVDLDAAYKREFIFLSSQKKALSKQKKQINRKYETAIRQAKKNISLLQDKIIGLNAVNEKLDNELYKLEQNVENSSENKTLLENTLKQASGTLKVKDLELKASSLQNVFEKALIELNGKNFTSGSTQSFFLPSGEEVSGTIIKMGQVASYGRYQNEYFMLAPAGNGMLKAWKKLPLEQTAFSKISPKRFPLFIYEGLNKEVQKKKSQTLIEFINAGGTIAWVIISMGLVGVLLAFIRMFNLKKYSNVMNKIEGLNEEKFEKELKEKFFKQSQGQYFIKLIHNLSREKDELRDIVDEGMIHEHKSIDKFGAIILVFAAVAPLLGLLGTVTGMISTFDIITEFGTGDPKLLSHGISEALITTELGLVVAIPTLLLGNILSGHGKNIKMQLEKLTLKIINRNSQ